MAEPLTLGLIAGGTWLADKAYDYFTNRRLRELQEEVLDQQVQFNNDLARRARGKFTSTEIAQIRRDAAPQINAVAGNVAARGLGTSPAGAALVNEAIQAPFAAAQQAASSAYPGSLTALSGRIDNRLASFTNDRFFSDALKTISDNYKVLQGFEGPNKDPNVAAAVNQLSGGQGYLRDNTYVPPDAFKPADIGGSGDIYDQLWKLPNK